MTDWAAVVQALAALAILFLTIRLIKVTQSYVTETHHIVEENRRLVEETKTMANINQAMFVMESTPILAVSEWSLSYTQTGVVEVTLIWENVGKGAAISPHFSVITRFNTSEQPPIREGEGQQRGQPRTLESDGRQALAPMGKSRVLARLMMNDYYPEDRASVIDARVEYHDAAWNSYEVSHCLGRSLDLKWRPWGQREWRTFRELPFK